MFRLGGVPNSGNASTESVRCARNAQGRGLALRREIPGLTSRRSAERRAGLARNGRGAPPGIIRRFRRKNGFEPLNCQVNRNGSGPFRTARGQGVMCSPAAVSTAGAAMGCGRWCPVGWHGKPDCSGPVPESGSGGHAMRSGVFSQMKLTRLLRPATETLSVNLRTNVVVLPGGDCCSAS